MPGVLPRATLQGARQLMLAHQIMNNAFTPSQRRDILDISSPLNDAGAALVDDSFLRCFKTLADEPWNWNVYLYPLWAVGVVVRNCILFPLRCMVNTLYSFVSLLLHFLAGVPAVGGGHDRAQLHPGPAQVSYQCFRPGQLHWWAAWLLFWAVGVDVRSCFLSAVR